MAYRPVIGGHHFQRVRGCSGRTSPTWQIKKILASLVAIGSLSFLTAGGTFALLTSQESNASSTVSTGTLTLSNLVTGGSACFSYGGPASPGNVNNACQAIFTSATQNYPGVPLTARLTITNNGSVNSSDLSVYMPGGCTAGTTPGAPTVTTPLNPCGAAGAQLYIQETNAAFTALKCWYPTTGTTCTWVANTLSVFATNFTTSASSVDLGAGPAHGQARYFIIGMELPPTASNALQGQMASFGLTWHITN